MEWFLRLRIVRIVIIWSKRHSLPGFFQVPIYDTLVFLFNELRRFDLFTRANAVAYSFFLSLFPSIMALFTLLPIFKQYFIRYLPNSENFDQQLEEAIRQILPGVAGDRLFQFVYNVINEPRYGLLSFGFLLAILFASNGMLALMQGFEKSYEMTFKRRGELKKRLIAVLLTFQVGTLVIGSVILVILGDFLVGLITDFIHLDFLSILLLNLTRWLGILLLYYLGIAVIYRYGVPVHKKFNIFSPGATLSTILCIITSLAFSYYVNRFNTYNELYGSIGTIIVLMIWIQLNSLILLIGFELNASIAVNRDLKRGVEEDNRLF
jgi:membrane protein